MKQMREASVGQPHMESINKQIHNSSPGSEVPYHFDASKRPLKELEVALALLRKKDDTSCFVGLALLKPVLEQELGQSGSTEEGKIEITERSWGAIPTKFLDRLLKARPKEGRTREEANDMVSLAVVVLHAFMGLLDSPHTDVKFTGRVTTLMSIVHTTPPATRAQVLDILHTLATTPRAASVLFEADMAFKVSERKPSSYLVMTMLLIDIRSTIPSLKEKLHSSDYPATSKRMAQAYDITSTFIGYLVEIADTLTSDDEEPVRGIALPMPSDLLQNLRPQITQAMSDTIEHLRDRYDFSNAGAAGLHPSARPLNGVSSSDPLPLAWDTSSGMFTDPLTLAQLRTLSLWLRDEDDNDLRKEAAGIMDVLLALYQTDLEPDLRAPSLAAMEGIIRVDEGIEAFLHQGGWDILVNDLGRILSMRGEEYEIGETIGSVLTAVAQSDVAGLTRQERMWIIPHAHKHLKAAADVTPRYVGLVTATARLAVTLLKYAHHTFREPYSQDVKGILKTVKLLLDNGKNMSVAARNGLEEVARNLEEEV